MLKNQRGQTLVEFAIAIMIFFLFVFGLIGLAYWGTASVIAQEVAHEVAREYAVSGDEDRAKKTGRSAINWLGYILIDPNSIDIEEPKRTSDKKVTAVVSVKPRINNFGWYKVEKISKESQATLEHYLRPNNKDEYAR